MKYNLVNPSIQGEFNNSLKATNDLDAAQKFWNGMSRYFTNSLDNFAFTIMNKDGELSHFLATEKVSNNNVEYKIKKIKAELSHEESNKLISASKATQQGGKKHRKKKDKDSDDSSSSSSSSDYHIYRKNSNIYPIVSWDYWPSIYPVDIIDVVSIPTWVSPIVPTSMNYHVRLL